MCSEETDLQILVDTLSSLKTLIEAPGYQFLTNEEVNYMGEIIINLLQEHGKTSKKNDLSQDYLKKTINDILSALFKSHKGLSFGILEYVYTNVIGKFLSDNSNESDKIFALIVIGDIIECVWDVLNTDKLKELSNTLLSFLSSDSEKVRKAAFYGISVMISHFSKEKFVVVIEDVLKALESVIVSAGDSQKKSEIRTKELALAIFGNVIKYQRNCLKLEIVLPWWINQLPILTHTKLAKDTHDFLADLVINEAKEFAQDERLVNVFLTIAYTGHCSSQTLPKISKILEMFFEVKGSACLQACNRPDFKEKLDRLLLN